METLETLPVMTISTADTWLYGNNRNYLIISTTTYILNLYIRSLSSLEFQHQMLRFEI